MPEKIIGADVEQLATAQRTRSPLGDRESALRARRQLRRFALFALGLSLAFALPLFGLIRYSLTTGLYSHVLLIPCVSAYLVWLRRQESLPSVSPSPGLAVIPLAMALAALSPMLFPGATFLPRPPENYYALTTFCYLGFLWTGAFWFLGGTFLRHFLFPAAFLVFMMPMPAWLRHGVEVFFQHTSADAAALLFAVTGSTVFRDGLIFQLPGITLQVAEECSGIRSSYVLFITSLLAGYLFLQSPWRRTALALFVIPLAIARNGFRVFTLGWLCVHVSPAMIDSPIHHRGGPLFFALSLVPFLLLLLWLRRRERRGHPPGRTGHGG